MAINGVETIIFGAKDPRDLIRFFGDFGLVGEHDDTSADFTLPEGSRVLVRKSDDASLPHAFLTGDGPREVIWGVDSQHAIEALEADLRSDYEIAKDADGTLHLTDPVGLRIGFRVFKRNAIEQSRNFENSLTDRPRWNTMRKFYGRARPKMIQHVVFSTSEIDKALDFYVKRLKFRISDVSRGRGIFLRAEGRNEHHNLFFVNRPLDFNHIAFGLDSIDELMVGANHMQRSGWSSAAGLGRHRVSSILFYYMACPTGGEIEYAADGDYLDDGWVPRVWEPADAMRYWSAGNTAAPPPSENPGAPLPNPIPRFTDIR